MSTNPLREDSESWLKRCEKLQYNREQLLHLKKTSFAPEYAQKVVRELGAEIHEKQQIAAAFQIADSSFTGILENKKQDSYSEARKEKKKLRRRKQLAKTNGKLDITSILQGEKCKFLHDVAPLTKSKPCRHFIHQSCMKGDDCAFDHDLSKYPCDSFVDTGFCGRGESCLFSHKDQFKESSEPSSATVKCDTISMDQHGTPFIFGKASPDNLKKKTSGSSVSAAGTPTPYRDFKFSKSKDFSTPTLSQERELGFSETFKGTPTPTPSSALNLSNIFNGGSSGSSTNGKTLLNDSDKNQLEGAFGTKYAVGTLTPSRGFEFSEVFKANLRSLERARKFHAIVKGGVKDSSSRNLKGTSGRSYDVCNFTRNTALHPSEKFEGFMSPTPTPERVANYSEICNRTPAPESAFLLSEVLKDLPTLTLNTERALNHSEMSKGALIPEKGKGTSVSSSGGGTANVFSTDINTCVREKGTVNVPEKSKESQHEPGLWGSQTSLSQFSSKVDVLVQKRKSNPRRNLGKAPNLLGTVKSGISDFSSRNQVKSNFGRSYVFGTSTPNEARNPFETFESSVTPIPSLERVPNDSEMSRDLPTLIPCPQRALKHPEMTKGALRLEKRKGTSVSSSHGPSYDISGGRTASVFRFGEKGRINASEKSKELQHGSGLVGSQTLMSRLSTKKNMQNNPPKALESGFTFAANNESGIKMNSMGATKESNLNMERSCSSSRRRYKPLRKNLLNRQGDGEKK